MGVHHEIRDGVAIVTIDNPPVNAMGQAVREALWQIAGAVEQDDTVRAVVLCGAGKLFIGGADISEFDRPALEPHLPDLLARVEAASKPWIAAMHGSALGGGVEIALACRFRVAAVGSRFSLPETNLGLIPGSGGTQRLPRLIGVQEAIRVVAENATLDDARALQLGFIDKLIEGEFLAETVAFAQEIIGQPTPKLPRERAISDPGSAFWEENYERISKSARGLSAPRSALDAVRFGVENGVELGLKREREIFLRLKTSEESAALRYLFFAERAALRPADLRGVMARPVALVGVVGGGTMGVGIAAALRNAGLPVILSERDEASLSRGTTALRAIFESAVKRRSISPAESEARFAGVKGVVGLAALSDCDLVIEAVFEEVEVKRQVFSDLVSTCRPDAIIATNTSYIDPRVIAEGLSGQERFIGLHFFSPAHIMKLLEIVPLPTTGLDVQAAAFSLAQRMGKIPARSGICDGFIGNRILRRYRAEAEAMIADGISYTAIDEAMRQFGYAMGPFEMQDLAGLDISFLHREAARARGAVLPPTPGDLLVRAGRKGQKTGAGWYDYDPGDRTPRSSKEAQEILAPMIDGVREVAPSTIVKRLIDAMADEGQLILQANIASGPEVIDLVEVHGYGFPRGKGGPMFQSARVGRVAAAAI